MMPYKGVETGGRKRNTEQVREEARRGAKKTVRKEKKDNIRRENKENKKIGC